ncbi:MAG: NTP transferase domain-containing protein [Candidatus Hydrogenedentota bacterium]
MPINEIAIILAAGFSSRMNGFPKPILTLNKNQKFVDKVDETYKSLGIDTVIVIRDDKRVINYIKRKRYKFVINKNPQRGMHSSIETGFNLIKETGIDRIFIHPVDVPLVKTETIKSLKEHSLKDKIIVPVYQGRKGHPILIPQKYLEDIIHTDDFKNKGLRVMFSMLKKKIIELEVNDNFILLDFDTEIDYKRLQKMVCGFQATAGCSP